MKSFYAIVFCALTLSLAADFRLRNIYSDNMVLQRDVPVKIYGYAMPGERITGILANGGEVVAAADKNGEFILKFPAMPAGGPHELLIRNSQNQEIWIRNIAVGEVYFAAGQSNMEMPLWSNKRFFRSYKGDAELRNADFPQIRFVKIPKKISHKKIKNDISPTSWQVVSPAAAASNSAVAYYFAREMHRNLRVPVGIIQASWSGTQIEPWISREAFFDSGDEIGIRAFADYELDFSIRKAEYNKKLSVWAEKFHRSEPVLTARAAEWKEPDYDDSQWQKIILPATLTYVNDIKWVRKTVELPSGMAERELLLTIGAIDDCDETYFNGVKIGSVDITCDDHWQTVRKYKVPAGIVRKGKNVIAIRVFNYYAVGAIESYKHGISLATADGKEKIDLAGEWLIRDEFIADIRKTGPRPAFISRHQRTWNATIYNAMINPCIIYPIRGVIWYQGCSNGNEYQRYARLFPMLIRDWRKKWQNPEMPFIFVQLSAFGKQSPEFRGDENNWKTVKPLYASGEGYACIREVQTGALALPNTGMAVAIDKGDQYDIHPAHKAPIGYRLAQEALRISFGKKTVTSSPYFQKMKIEGSRIRLFFVNAGNGFEFSGNSINGFAIGDAEGNWDVAEVKIENGNELVVYSPSIKNPDRVRYAFCAYPGGLNLYNREGFPVCPFRTDR